MIIEGSKAWRDLLGKRGYGSAPKAVSRRRDWLRGIYPPPVYVATFPDGQTIRMSFWNRIGKPWDADRGRRLCASWHRTMTGTDCNIIAGHVEHDGTIQDTATKPARKRITTKQLKTTLSAILGLPELPAEQQASEALHLVAEARELIADPGPTDRPHAPRP